MVALNSRFTDPLTRHAQSLLDPVLAGQILERPEDFGGTPGILPSNSRPARLPSVLSRPPAGTGSATNPNATRTGPSIADLILGQVRKLGPVGRGVDRVLSPVADFAGEVGDAGRRAARTGALAGLAPSFTQGVLAGDRNTRANEMADLQRQLIERQLGSEPAAPESFEVLSDAEKTALGLPLDRPLQRSTSTGKISQIGGVAPTTTVNVGGEEAVDSIFDVAPDIRNRFATQEEGARGALTTLKAATEARRLVDSDAGVFTGATAGIQQVGARLLDAFSDPNSTDEDIQELRQTLANSEGFDSSTGIMVGQIIRLFGSGTGLSDADREFAKQIAGALRGGSKQGLQQILDNAISRSTSEIEAFNDRLRGSGLPDIGTLFPEIEFPQSSDGRPPGVSDEVWSIIQNDPSLRKAFE